MTEETTAPRPPAGWLLDSTTGQTRWWDGSQWTEHVKSEPSTLPTRASLRAAAAAGAPADLSSMPGEHGRDDALPGSQTGTFPSPYVAPTLAPTRIPDESYISSIPPYGGNYSRRPLTSKNGPAKASLILNLLLALGIGVVVWLLSGQDPIVATLVGLLNVAMVLAAFILAVVGLVIAIRRPTKKRESVFALVLSSVLMAFLAVRVALSFAEPTLVGPVLESEVATWLQHETGEPFRVACPPSPSAVAGSVFFCSAEGVGGAEGTAWEIRVTVDTDERVWWEVV